MTFRDQRSRSNPKNFEVEYLKTVRDREMLSIEVKSEVIYGLSNGIKLFDPRWPLGVKGQGQTCTTPSPHPSSHLKLLDSRTVCVMYRTRLQNCVRDISDWFLTNCMQLTGDKSEAMLFALGAQAAKVNPKATVDIVGSAMELSADIRSVGVHMDGQLNMDRHVNSVCSSCYYHIRALRRIRLSLNQETAANIGRSVVSSRLDYCNSLMYGFFRATMKKLQRVQIALIRVICSLGPGDSVSGARRDLHWLEQRIIFKIDVLTFNCRRRSAPPYLCDLVHDYLPRRGLRSGDGVTLEVPRTKTVTAERAFSVAAPAIWNDRPLKLRQSTYFNGFKTELKTRLFITC